MRFCPKALNYVVNENGIKIWDNITGWALLISIPEDENGKKVWNRKQSKVKKGNVLSEFNFYWKQLRVHKSQPRNKLF